MSLFEAINVKTSFQNKTVLNGLSFQFDRPFLFILGSNGSGKTTLLKSIVGLLDCSGEFRFQNKLIPPVQRHQVVSICFQSNELIQNLLVKDILVMARYSSKGITEGFNEEDFEIVKHAAQQFKIAHLLESYYLELSGGQQKMVWITQAFMSQAPFLLLDEPTTHLDLQFRGILEKEMLETKRVVICSTHDFDFLDAFPQKLAQYLVLKNGEGEIYEDISIEQLKARMYE